MPILGRLVLTVALLSVARARDLRGQEPPSAPTSATTVLDRRFAIGEPVSFRVGLERGVVYRIWLSRPARISGLTEERPNFPFIVDITGSSGIDNGVEFEVYPQNAGLVTLIIEPSTKDSVTDVVIWRDVRGTVRGDPNERGPDDNWELGFEVAGGWHSRMGTASTGGEAEGCVRVRRGWGRASRFSGCVLGLASYWRPGAGRISILFFEPRVRLAGTPLSSHHGGTEFGVALRLGLFGSEQGADAARGGVGLGGVGPYLEHGFGHAEHPSGWGVRLSVMAEVGGDGPTDFRTTNTRLGVSYQF